MWERLQGDQGAIAVITAIVLTVLLLVSAFIIDLGALRADRVTGKSVADMASTAAMIDYRPGEAGAPQQACEEALTYAVDNLREAGTPVPDPGQACGEVFPSTYACQPGDDNQAIYTLGSYEITIAIPVRDAPNDNGLLDGLDHGENFDGRPCERIGVRVLRDRNLLLAGLTGIASGATAPSAVAKAFEGDEGEFASLVVLKRTGCETLDSGGSGELRVNKLELGGDTYRGLIAVDTQQSGCQSGVNQNQKVVRAGGNSLLWADGAIESYSLATTDPDNTYTYREGAVGTSATDPENLWPRPEAGELVTRSIVDYRYNCQTDGYGSAPYEPSASQPIDDCDVDAPPEPVMEYLHDWLADGSGVPAGDWFTAPAGICDKNNGPVVITGEPRVFIDCPGDFEPDDVTITGAEHVVVNGDLEMGNSENLTITGHAQRGATFVLRDGNFDRTGGNLRLRNVFTYAVSGRLNLRGTSGDILWQGPDKLESAEVADCLPEEERPSASCFGPLAFWGNGNVSNNVRGTASGGIIGTIFTPNGTTELHGGQSVDESPCTGIPDWDDLVLSTGSLNLEGAQFLSNEFLFRGSSGLRMCPNPNLLTTSGWKVNLIR
jgi:hypothetical protein